MSERSTRRGRIRRGTLTLGDLDGPVAVADGGTGAATAADARTNLGIVAGKWTPTLTNVANLDASTAYECMYIQVGAIVHFAGRVDVDPTAPATETKLGISLPVASNFGAAEDAAGAAFCPDVAGQGAAVHADAANNRLEMEWASGDITNQPMYFSGAYEVI